MSKQTTTKLDKFSVKLAETVIKWRWPLMILTLLIVIGVGAGGQHIGFSTNYRIFFSKENLQLNTFTELENTYSKTDNILFVLKPKEGDAFQPRVLEAVQKLTEESWKLPYVTRVDSVSNFQHTYAEEDDLIVADLVENDPSTYSENELKNIKKVAVNEPLLRDRIVSPDGKTTGVNAIVQFTREDPAEVPITTAAARELLAQINAEYPEIETALSGMVIMNNAFMEASMKDMSTLVPAMYLVLLVALLVFFRSVSGTVATMFVMAFSTMLAMGAAGWLGIKLTPPSATAPTIILTLAVADSVHILVSMFKEMRDNMMSKHQAIIEAVRVNLQPVFLTSITTAIGFLSLNFSDAPPFGHLGNITAIGVMGAFVFSIVFLPAFMSLMPLRLAQKRQEKQTKNSAMVGLGNAVVKNRSVLLYGMAFVVIILTALVPRIELNDEFVQYFDKSVSFRADTEFMLDNLTGIYQAEYSLAAKNDGGISEPEYLENLENYANWLRKQPEVIHVYSLTDVFKRLNKNLNADDENFYRIPEERDLAAQYLLLYEMSLPYGLDLNDRVNVDKSATRLTVTTIDMSTRKFRDLLDRIDAWQKENMPAYMHADATSPTVMFSYISERNIKSMVSGNLLALFLISALIGIALRSTKLGFFSLMPNLAPIGMAFGIWSIMSGQVNMASATVSAVCLGIVVDDTVHFLSKYFRARQEKGLDAADSVRYAFTTVGPALVITTLTLTFGFAVLAFSTFQLNQVMGILTAITIVCALLADFTLLPAALLYFDRNKKKKGDKKMKAVAAIFAAILATGALSAHAEKTAEEILASGGTPDEIGKKIAVELDERDFGFDDMEVEIQMTLRNAHGETSTREMRNITFEMKDMSVGDKTMIIFDHPRDVAGTAFLTYSQILDPDDQWLYLPALRRVKRISSKNKSGPFMGSEFAYEDIGSQEVEKYGYKYIKSEACPTNAAQQCFVVERYPLYEHSGYTKQTAWIDYDEFLLQKVDFYDRKKELMKTLTYVDYKEYLGKYWRAGAFYMKNHQTGKSTDLYWNNYKFRTGVRENDLTQAKLKSVR